ncbi:MAG: Iron-sulfur cluster insertion protein ErpA [Methanosaeta sp. PtaB.Bin039]|nr:MAG: Iron-sulfur cluster insertion protein ErpA [Methanosaeta sp. PtaB.Bin039]OPY46460.1 MAG: Iron-sulfur cluster insertion protein ErpA [Methanosaeta sp. PtaU1.Bin028]HOT07938.1 iron-sulfur cluster biosynthesis family protein [Methanotrichaceae archaeon]HQF16848.1 iron-sulfur cluster biosynthesis family protein [Methanotrichaceae archaeon]HQI91414.1 iron-sulfur cluster biosynthesis family protein [Methanotrichaceae archaeon]
MIEITDAAAQKIRSGLVDGKVVRMFLAAIDASGANYGLALTEPQKDDIRFESNGITIHMSPVDAEMLGETIIDYIDSEEIGTGFIIRGPLDDMGGCGCGGHDHEHGGDGEHHGCGCH